MKKNYGILLLLVVLSSCQKSQDYNDNILKFYGDVYEDIGYSVAKTDNGYVIGGQLTIVSRTGNYINIDKSQNNKKLAIIKTGADGNVIWKKSFGDKLTGAGSKVIVLDDGSIVCTGYVTDTVSLQKDIFVVKTDGDGGNLVQKVYASTGNQYGIDIVKTSEGFLILGSTDVARLPLTDSTGNIAGNKDILLLRTDNNLVQIQSIATGYPGNDVGAAIKPDVNGGYIVAGTTDRSEIKTQQAANNILLFKVNSSFQVTDPKIIGKTDDEYAVDLEVSGDGWYIIPVTVGADGTNQKGFLLKMPQDNNPSPPVFGSYIALSDPTLSYSLKAISKYKTNSFVLAGQTGTGTLAKMLIIAVDADGNKLEGKEKILVGTGSQAAYDVISDTDGYIIAVGKNSYETNSLICLLKFRF
jgi:hypothetical protein